MHLEDFSLLPIALCFLFGLDVTLSQSKPQHVSYLRDNQFHVFTGKAITSDPAEAMNETLAFLKKDCDMILLHFDVDVGDSSK
ncbi:uncharacterized protein Z518_02610 [Rhinocladiella mackenziei CBS 650.93]|uniref:Uncharacterized protein n=1 Tax=Rhinocladiella mackenziei CBS 650.93 TaxID=1442369 RepID=A0A0D2IX94_9EURO|nr:uncharacterized protein Z518_02610 [Rhinocladiella mackenziei CBS 650.93]KIX07956.1 hypothetical protein Z518_02610 [Rhinocladiella mackenziei CBS 650.93]